MHSIWRYIFQNSDLEEILFYAASKNIFGNCLLRRISKFHNRRHLYYEKRYNKEALIG